MKNKIRAFLRMNKLAVKVIGYAIYVTILELRYLWIVIRMKSNDLCTEKDIRFFRHYIKVNAKGRMLCDEGIAICHEMQTKEES